MSTTIFVQAPLPYPENALEPFISARTFSFHYGRHHKAYVDKAADLVKCTPWAGQPVEEVIRQSAGKPEFAALFNNAAQAWNHAFFWTCLKPGGGGMPSGPLADALAKAFGSVESFKKQFIEAAVGQFGSGWAWLVADGGTLKIEKTANADTPLAHGRRPLFTVDVWEHAYYLDYQNRRADFVQTVLDKLADWDGVARRLTA